MREATREELRAQHTAEIVRELGAFLSEVYELAAPEVPDVPTWDPPETDDFTVAMGPEAAVWDPLDRYQPRPERDDQTPEAVFYRSRYHDALALVAKYAELASSLDDKLRELSLDDHANVLADLSDRAKRLREDLGL